MIPFTHPRLAAAAIVLTTASAFGPYTALPGVRTEQLVVYGLLLVLLPFSLLRIKASAEGMTVMLLLAGTAAFALAGGAFAFSGARPYPAGALLPGLDNLVLPLAVVLLVHALLLVAASPQHLLQVAARATVVAGALNAVLALISTQYDLSGPLSRFWSGAHSGTRTVAAEAAALGRYSGVFNQPAEAGLLYGVALLAAIYVLRSRPAALAATCMIITVGGAISVSKVLLFVGVPLAVWQLARMPLRHARGWVLGAVAAAGLALLAQAGALPAWAGARRLETVLRPGEFSLESYSAGRFGSSGSVSGAMTQVLETSPWTGFGAAGLDIPYDSLWLEALAVAGLFGVASYVSILLVLGFGYMRTRRHHPSEAALGAGLLLLVVGASLGVPALTVNRAATPLWILLTLSLLTLRNGTPIRVATPDSPVGRHPQARRTDVASLAEPGAARPPFREEPVGPLPLTRQVVRGR